MVGAKGRLLLGAFFGVGVNVGITSSGKVFMQLQESTTVGIGGFVGYGYGVGTASSAVTPTGFSTSGAWIAQVNAGWVYAGGASISRDYDGHWGGSASPFYKVGAGFGGQVSVGPQGTATLATPSFSVLRRLLGNNCR